MGLSYSLVGLDATVSRGVVLTVGGGVLRKISGIADPPLIVLRGSKVQAKYAGLGMSEKFLLVFYNSPTIGPYRMNTIHVPFRELSDPNIADAVNRAASVRLKEFWEAGGPGEASLF
uniref:Uncharacterized protein n=1 Tax=uncultured prokaryote TaxID=198431 RepID=A0A0H5Q7U2_9ZZZZ|nr:hypothetical protein [uncultured prokaryote]